MADSTRMDEGAARASGDVRPETPIMPGPDDAEAEVEIDVAAFERAEAELEESAAPFEDAGVGEAGLDDPRVRDGLGRSEGREGPSTTSAADAGEGKSDGGVCPVGFCPIGMALSVVQGTKPDAVEHLLVAGREFLLAARSVLDARAEAAGSSSLKRIEID
jgi:hypothetical protein